MKFYKGCKGENADEINALNAEFERLKSIAHEKKTDEKMYLKDICEYFIVKIRKRFFFKQKIIVYFS